MGQRGNIQPTPFFMMEYDKVGEDENEEEDFTRYIYIVLVLYSYLTTRFFFGIHRQNFLLLSRIET